MPSIDHTPPQSPPLHDSEQDGNWSYTYLGSDVVALRQELERQAGRDVRHTIGRDSRLSEGVYEGAYGGEAIVINYDDDPELIDEAVEKVLSAARDETGLIHKDKILESVFLHVKANMRYDAKAVDDLFDRELDSQDGRKVSLGMYIQGDEKGGFGVCRHQALYAGIILEKLKDQGIISGTASVDRNMIRRGADGKYDGHAWTRYTNSAGVVFILDIAQNKLGTLEQMMHEHSRDPDHTWDYARPEDKRSRMGHQVARVIKLPFYKPEDYTNKDGIIDRVPWDTGK